MRDPKKNKKSKKVKIILGVVIAVVLALGVSAAAVYHSQKNNIAALKYAKGYSQEELKTKMAENEAKESQSLNKVTDKSFKSLSDEDRKKLESGELSEEEAIAIIMGDNNDTPSGEGQVASEDKNSDGNTEVTENSGSKTDNKADEKTSEANSNSTSENANTDTKNNSQGESTGSASTASSSSSSKASSNVDAVLAKIYLLKAEFSNSIDALLAQASADLASGTSKTDLLQKYSGTAGELESQCDARMNSLISELSTALKESGGDQSIVNDIQSSYEEEKSLKKASLISNYM